MKATTFKPAAASEKRDAIPGRLQVKAEAGLWIDHREAVIVVLSEDGQVTKRIQSHGERQLRRSGEPSTGRFEYQAVPADDSRQREYTGQLARYYDEVISFLEDAESVFIFGPGEAKGELKKRFAKEKTATRLVSVETADKMTEAQIVAHVRQHFQPEGKGTPGIHHRNRLKPLKHRTSLPDVPAAGELYQTETDDAPAAAASSSAASGSPLSEGEEPRG